METESRGRDNIRQDYQAGFYLASGDVLMKSLKNY